MSATQLPHPLDNCVVEMDSQAPMFKGYIVSYGVYCWAHDLRHTFVTTDEWVDAIAERLAKVEVEEGEVIVLNIDGSLRAEALRYANRQRRWSL